VRAFLRRTIALVCLLFGCTTTSATERRADLTTSAREVTASATSTHDVETRDVEQGPTIETSCEGRADDCARALLDALATQPPEADSGQADAGAPRASGPVKVTRKVTLPIGADPRLPPAPGPTAPAFRETERIDHSASSTAASEKDDDSHLKDEQETTRTTDLGFSWQVKAGILAAVLLALFLAYRFTPPGRSLAALISKA
jgi:hypothetical protein